MTQENTAMEDAGSTAVLELQTTPQKNRILFVSFVALMKLVAADAVTEEELENGLYCLASPWQDIEAGPEKWGLRSFEVTPQQLVDIYNLIFTHLGKAEQESRLVLLREKQEDRPEAWECHSALNQMLEFNGYSPFPYSKPMTSSKGELFNGTWLPDIDDHLLAAHSRGENTGLIALWSHKNGHWSMARREASV